MKLVRWTSTATPNGVSGAPTLATREKGRVIVETATSNLLDFIREFRELTPGTRVDHRVRASERIEARR
jgi:creatinine amidohydrolase/Fe(II)-dependent formamide hydrolase-like protein